MSDYGPSKESKNRMVDIDSGAEGSTVEGGNHSG